jgi:hypothetical protein
MLLTEVMGMEQEKIEEPEQFFARYILTRAFENDAAGPRPTVLAVGLVDPNTAYELARIKAADDGEDLFMVRVASYPSRGVDDWVRSAIFSARHEARTYIHFLKSEGVSAQRV